MTDIENKAVAAVEAVQAAKSVKKNDEATVILDSKVANHLMNEWTLEIRPKSFKMQKFKISADYKGKKLSVSSVPYRMPANLYCEFATVADTTVSYCGDDPVVEKDFSFDYIAFEVEKTDRFHILDVKVAEGISLEKVIRDHCLYVVNGDLCIELDDGFYHPIDNLRRNRKAVPVDGTEYRMYNFVAVEEVDNEEADDGALDQTAGEKKKNLIIFADVSSEAKRKRIKALRGAITNGVTDITNARNIWAPQKVAVPASNRKSNRMAPSSSFGKIKAYAILIGKFNRCGFESMDGLTIVGENDFLADVNTLNENFSIGKNVILGTGVQYRSYSLKTLGIVFSAEFMKLVCRHQCHKGCVVISRDNITDEIQATFNAIWYGKGEHEWSGKLLIVVENEEQKGMLEFDNDGNLLNPEILSFIADLNGMKAPYKVASKSSWEVLSYSHATLNIRKGATLSGQVLQSLLYIDKERTGDFVTNLTYRELDKKYVRFAEDKVHDMDLGFIGASGIGRAISDINHEVAGCTRFFPQFKNIVEHSVKDELKKALYSRYRIGGFYTKCNVDYGAWCNIQILKMHKAYVECYSSLADEKGIRWGIGVKYPKAGVNEYILIRFLTKAEYIAKTRMACTPEDAKAIIEMIEHSDGGMLVLPAYEELKDLLAGMDFDGDSIIVVTEKEIVAMFMNSRFVCTGIDSEDNGRNDKDVHDASLEEAIEIGKPYGFKAGMEQE